MRKLTCLVATIAAAMCVAGCEWENSNDGNDITANNTGNGTINIYTGNNNNSGNTGENEGETDKMSKTVLMDGKQVRKVQETQLKEVRK
jgi:hypothetical protein